MLNSGIYTDDTTTIVHGDCLCALAHVPDESVDLIFADPPYNIGKKFAQFKDVWPSDEEYAEWCYSWLALCITKLKRSGSMYIMTSTQAMPYLDLWLRKQVEVLCRIVWHYDSSGVQAKKYYGSMYEPILFCVKDSKNYTFNADDIEVEAKTGSIRKLIDYRKEVPTPYKDTKIPGNTWYFPRVRYRMPEYEEHPSQKPEALLERVIKASSKPGDLVLDPFSGTFTTCAVAQRLGRRSIGIEAQEQYVKIGLRRLNLATDFNGEELKAIVKTTARKNSNGIRGGALLDTADQGGLFNGEATSTLALMRRE
jgi:adenine-specific DNA-methyltransferase